jgi:hypothetical protein
VLKMGDSDEELAVKILFGIFALVIIFIVAVTLISALFAERTLLQVGDTEIKGSLAFVIVGVAGLVIALAILGFLWSVAVRLGLVKK